MDESEYLRHMLIDSGKTYEMMAEAKHKWNTEQIQNEYVIHNFLAPFVSVTRKCDGTKGTMMFTHHPRWYFNFVPNQKENT